MGLSGPVLPNIQEGLGSMPTAGIVPVINYPIRSRDIAQWDSIFAWHVSEEKVSSTAFVRQNLFLSERPKTVCLSGMQVHPGSAERGQSSSPKNL